MPQGTDWIWVAAFLVVVVIVFVAIGAQIWRVERQISNNAESRRHDAHWNRGTEE